MHLSKLMNIVSNQHHNRAAEGNGTMEPKSLFYVLIVLCEYITGIAVWYAEWDADTYKSYY